MRFIVYFLISFFLTGCLGNMTAVQKIQFCQDTLKVIVQPECARLAEKGQEYVVLCNSAVEDAIQGCEAAILKDGSLMCERISEKANQCSLIPDDTDNQAANVATCERVLRGAGLLCTLATASAVPEPVEEPVE